MDQLGALQVLIAVADTGSFSRAAERLGLSRAMASRHILELEARLGVRLFNRTTRRVALTEQGATFVERCRDVIADLETAEREVTSKAAEPVGRLRVNAPMTFGARYIAPCISDFAMRHPGVSIDLVLNDRFVDLVEEGYDIAIRIGRLTDSSMVARRIGGTRIIAAASPGYLARRGVPQAPADLTRHDCLHYAYATARNVWMFEDRDGPVAQRIDSRVSCNNGDALCQMAMAGLGLVREPDFILGPEIAAGRLVEVLADFAPPAIGIHALHPSGRLVPLKVRAFIDFLAAAFPSGHDWSAPLACSG